MCGEICAEPAKPLFRSLKELEDDYARRRRPRPALRPLEELETDFASRRKCAAHPSVLRSLKELTADFNSRLASSRAQQSHEAWTCVVEATVAKGCWSNQSYGRDELLAVLASMQQSGPECGPGLRATRGIEAPPGLSLENDWQAPRLDVEAPGVEAPPGLSLEGDSQALCVGAGLPTIGAPPGLSLQGVSQAPRLDVEELLVQMEETSLDDHELLAWVEAHEDCERSPDAIGNESIELHTELRALQQWALQEAVAEAGQYWWDEVGEQQQYWAEEEIWTFGEGLTGAHDHFWHYGNAFGDQFVRREMSYGLLEKSVIAAAGDKHAELCQSSTAPTDKESDSESRGDEAETQFTSCWW